MLQQGIISPVTVPIEWCSGIVPVPKPNRCMDLYRPNTPEQSVATWNLSHGFCWWEPCHARWKQSIHKIGCEQKFLANSFGWGLRIVDHLYHSLLLLLLQLLAHVSLYSANYGQPCWRTWIDDIWILGRDHMENNACVWAVLFRLWRAGLTLNIQKCELLQRILQFLGHMSMPRVSMLTQRRQVLLDIFQPQQK